MLSHANWQGSGHALGALWDLEKIATMAELLSNDAGTTREKGVVSMAHITTIGINQYVCPPLHMLLGIGNTIFSDFIGWIDQWGGLEISSVAANC